MNDDWRLVNQEQYLLRKKLQKKTFPERYDHAHCAFCWEKFGKDYHSSGYCTLDEQHWICNHCFEDFKDHFHWRVVTEGEPMVFKRDGEYWARYTGLIVCLIVAFLCFKFGLEMSWGFCIGLFVPMFLWGVLDAIASGRTFEMDVQGITVSFWRFRKTYLWEELQTKLIEEYAFLTYGRSYGNCPYHKGAIFAPGRVRKPRWIGRPAYAPFHPWRFIYVNFYVAPPKYTSRLFPDWQGRCYEVKEEEFLGTMKQWHVELEGQ